MSSSGRPIFIEEGRKPARFGNLRVDAFPCAGGGLLMRHRSIGALFAAAFVVAVAGAVPACGGADFTAPEDQADTGDDSLGDGLSDGTGTDTTTTDTDRDTTAESSSDSPSDSTSDTDETDTGGSSDSSTDS